MKRGSISPVGENVLRPFTRLVRVPLDQSESNPHAGLNHRLESAKARLQRFSVRSMRSSNTYACRPLIPAAKFLPQDQAPRAVVITPTVVATPSTTAVAPEFHCETFSSAHRGRRLRWSRRRAQRSRSKYFLLPWLNSWGYTTTLPPEAPCQHNHWHRLRGVMVTPLARNAPKLCPAEPSKLMRMVSSGRPCDP